MRCTSDTFVCTDAFVCTNAVSDGGDNRYPARSDAVPAPVCYADTDAYADFYTLSYTNSLAYRHSARLTSIGDGDGLSRPPLSHADTSPNRYTAAVGLCPPSSSRTSFRHAGGFLEWKR